MNILDQVKAILSEVLGADTNSICSDTVAADVDGWDSLNHVTLLMFISQHFSIEISDAESDRLGSVGDLVALIESKTARMG